MGKETRGWENLGVIAALSGLRLSQEVGFNTGDVSIHRIGITSFE